MRYALPALTTLVALLLYVVVSINVGRARMKFKVAAPAVTGSPDFERVYRVQMNTLEQLVAFLPALWLFAFFLSPLWASAIGAAWIVGMGATPAEYAAWIVGRVLYALGYYSAAEKRGAGFAISFFAFAALWGGACWGVVSALFQS